MFVTSPNMTEARAGLYFKIKWSKKGESEILQSFILILLSLFPHIGGKSKWSYTPTLHCSSAKFRNSLIFNIHIFVSSGDAAALQVEQRGHEL